jgi:hypothetical protein
MLVLVTFLMLPPHPIAQSLTFRAMQGHVVSATVLMTAA